MNSKIYMEYMDALKGIAIIAVTMVHTGGGNLEGVLGKIGSQGARGVQLFFMISAILNYSSAERIFKSAEGVNKNNLKKWYYKKLIRILPLYYFALIVTMMTKSWSPYWLGNEGHVTLKNILAHIFLVHGLFPHYTNSMLGIDWYLGTLVVFLLITPILYKYVNSFENSIILVILIYIFKPWFNDKLGMIFPIDSDPHIYNAYISIFGPLAEIFVYSLGIVLYFAMKKVEIPSNSRKILSYVLFGLSLILVWGQINGHNRIYHLTACEMFGLWFSLLVLSMSMYSNILINNGIFRTYGKYSYGIYLFQFIWINFYEKYFNFTGNNLFIIKFSTSLLALLLISICITRYIDVPIQKCCKRKV